MASCCETEESWNGRVRRISYVHKHTVTAGESKIPRITEKKTGTSQMEMYCYYGSLKEKIPAHVKIPRKHKKEDSGTCDNTSEVSDNTTEA